MISLVTSDHIDRAKEIHEVHYKSQFELPDFLNDFLLVYSSINKDGQLVSIAGVRPILEMIAITDPSKSARDKYHAVYDILQASMFTAAANKYDQLHAFIQDPHWKKVMLKRGFNESKGQALVIEV
jgi:hypothetical protein